LRQLSAYRLTTKDRRCRIEQVGADSEYRCSWACRNQFRDGRVGLGQSDRCGVRAESGLVVHRTTRFLVADGMGGHYAGNVASKEAVEALSRR
jgi:hypothetical protein